MASLDVLAVSNSLNQNHYVVHDGGSLCLLQPHYFPFGASLRGSRRVTNSMSGAHFTYSPPDSCCATPSLLLKR